jgi:glycosyltransferase involved in cell wall biosynthesis
MMPKLICIMPVYNCADVVLEALKSIDGKMDEILCLDGRWIGTSGLDHSTDETQKIILEFSIHSKSQVFYILLRPMHQWESRTAAFKYLNDGDWAIFLDSDEIITMWGDDVRQTLETSSEKAYRIYWSFHKLCAVHLRYGIIKKTETVHWSTDHRRVFDKDGEVDIVHAPVINIVIDHQPIAGTKKMRNREEEYKHWLHEYEITHWNSEDGPDPNRIEL